MTQSSFQRTFGNQGDYDLAPGSVFGVRWWSLRDDGMLGGVMAAWQPGPNTATCLAPASSRRSTTLAFRHWAAGSGPAVMPDDLMHGESEPLPECSVPNEDCTCGFYAFWNPDEQSQVSVRFPVLGVIEGFGRTLIGDRGFRCEKARIVALHVPTDPFGRSDLALIAEVEEALAERYVVPVYATKRLMLVKHPLTKEYAT